MKRFMKNAGIVAIIIGVVLFAVVSKTTNEQWRKSIADGFDNFSGRHGNGQHLYQENPVPNNSPPLQYSTGINTWRFSFDYGASLYDKRYNKTPNLFVNYPTRTTLSGEFVENGPLASNE